MSEPKFTPGPWLFHQPWSGFSKITGPNDELIFGIAAGSAEEKRPDDVCEANARLVAAAPEMYVAIAAAIPLWTLAIYEAEKRGDHEFVAHLRATGAEIDAALAKARGEG